MTRIADDRSRTARLKGTIHGVLALALLVGTAAAPAVAQQPSPEVSSLAVALAPRPPISLPVDAEQAGDRLLTPELTGQLIRNPELGAATPAQAEQLAWYQTQTFKNTIAPAALITAGLLAYGDGGFFDREAVREWRNTFIPDYEDHLDDYGQFLAGALALGLNAAGVPGKHNLLRASGTYALSLGIMMVTVHTGKELMAVKRPDDTSNNAFPSGHTAASFASARFLDKEYGHVSYLYSLGGYSIAAMTGVMRQLNNRHWLSDVLVGAGVGLLSTDIAYIVMDEIFKEKGVNPERPPRAERPRGNPSFLDFRLGYAQQVGDLDKSQGPFYAEQGWAAGFEGAYFFNDYIGLGGEISVNGFPINDDDFELPDDTVLIVTEEIVTQPFGSQSIYGGAFFNLPLAERWAIGAKLVAGVSVGANARLTIKVKEEYQDELGAKEIPIVEFQPSETFGAAANVAVRFMVSQRIGLRIFGDYNYSKPDYTVTRIVGVQPDGTIEYGLPLSVESVDFSYVSLGASVSALLW